jgi:hypothetical protein
MIKEAIDKEKILSNLEEFSGTETYYKWSSKIHFTDGIKYLADQCECYWLIDIVGSYAFTFAGQDFLTFNLKVEDESGVVTVTDGNDNILATQEIEYTDFPLDEINIWFSNNVIYLPSEH